MSDASEWEARKERERARVKVKLGTIVGLIERLGQEKDGIQRENTKARLIERFENLFYEGPGPDPEEPNPPQNPPSP